MPLEPLIRGIRNKKWTCLHYEPKRLILALLKYTGLKSDDSTNLGPINRNNASDCFISFLIVSQAGVFMLSYSDLKTSIRLVVYGVSGNTGMFASC